jgi:cysteine desulfurase
MKRIYLDYNATTPVDPRVLNEMLPYFCEEFGNPSSQSHSYGWIASKAVEKARKQVANLIGASPHEVIFTSGSTEASSLALLGFIDEFDNHHPGHPIHAITSCVEHNAVFETFKHLQERGVEVDFLPVNKYGTIEMSTVEKALKPHTKLMSFIWANNEIGSLNPIKTLGKFAKSHDIVFHTDATQAVGKFSTHVLDEGIDLMSFSSHKIYGPKGVGALYVRAHNPRIQLKSQIRGGGQERGLRSGTLNVPGIVGFGTACELAQLEMQQESEKLSFYRHYFLQKVREFVSDVQLNGEPENRIPGHLSLTFPGVSMDLLLPRMSSLAISTTSACASGSTESSHVLRGIGLTSTQASQTLRIGIGRMTTMEELDRAIAILKEALYNEERSPSV